DHRGFVHGWVCVEGVFDLTRPDFETGCVDQVLESVDEIDPTVLILYCDIARAQPTFGKGSGGRLGVLPVPRHDLWGGELKLSFLPVRQLRSVRSDDPHACVLHGNSDRE